MIYKGNFKKVFDTISIPYLLTHTPPTDPVSSLSDDALSTFLAPYIAAGYDSSIPYFNSIHQNNSNISFELPPFMSEPYTWWITKMLPGNIMPMHVDAHLSELTDPTCYWIPLMDWQPGHIFMYEDTVITNYKAGDVWEFSNPAAMHGSCNIGLTPRLILSITTSTLLQ